MNLNNVQWEPGRFLISAEMFKQHEGYKAENFSSKVTLNLSLKENAHQEDAWSNGPGISQI